MPKGAVVTGGSRGIGAGIARMLARANYDVVVAHWEDEDQAQALREEILGMGVRCFIFAGNLARAEVPSQLAAFAIDRLSSVTVLVNNAGITRYAPSQDFSSEMMDELYGLNFRAPLLLIRDLSRHMISQQIPGRVINIASTRGSRAYAEDSVYGGLKAP